MKIRLHLLVFSHHFSNIGVFSQKKEEEEYAINA